MAINQGMRQQPIRDRLVVLRLQVDTWKKYLQMNVDMCNWHGVEDAASDIRDFEAEIKALEFALSVVTK